MPLSPDGPWTCVAGSLSQVLFPVWTSYLCGRQLMFSPSAGWPLDRCCRRLIFLSGPISWMEPSGPCCSLAPGVASSPLSCCSCLLAVAADRPCYPHIAQLGVSSCKAGQGWSTRGTGSPALTLRSLHTGWASCQSRAALCASYPRWACSLSPKGCRF